MATRTSLYLRGDLEEEIKKRTRRRLDTAEPGPMGHVITRHLNALFSGYDLCRERVAQMLTYEEIRFLLHVVSSEGWDEDDLSVIDDLPNHVHRHWLHAQEDVKEKSSECIASDQAQDAGWLFWDQVNPKILAEKIEAMHPFDVLALMDGLLTVGAAEKRDRELMRLFKGITRPI